MSQNNKNNNNTPPPPPSPYYENEGDHTNNIHGRQQSPPRSAVSSYDERDYEDIYYHFDDYSQDILIDNAASFLDPQPAEHYEWEDVILDEVSQLELDGMKKSFCFGMGCGLLGFGALRLRRGGGGLFGTMSRYASSSRSNHAGGYRFDALPPPKAPSAVQQHHYQQQPAGSGLVFDVALGTFLGLGTSLLAFEFDTFYPSAQRGTAADSQQPLDNDDGNTMAAEPPPQWISPSVPLVPGRSVISDTLCQPLTEEFKKFPKELWRSGNLNRGIEAGYTNHMALYANSGWKGTRYYQGNENAEVVSLGENGGGGGGVANGSGTAPQGAGMYEKLLLDNLQGFVINCERRSRHERKLQKRKGMRRGSSQAVVIPEEGVTADEDLELDDIYLVDRGEEDAGIGL